jgi:hypothetical protein
MQQLSKNGSGEMRSGALTHPMAYLGRAITAVEVDAKLAAKLTQETSSAAVEVVHDDPQVGHRVSEGTASWSDLNDGAGGLFYKVDDGVDFLPRRLKTAPVL